MKLQRSGKERIIMPVKSVRLQKELKPLDEETRWQETLQALESVHQGKVVDGDGSLQLCSSGLSAFA